MLYWKSNKTIYFLIVTIFLISFLAISCGGGNGDQVEKASQKAATPGDIVQAFFDDCKAGKMKEAFEKYVEDGPEVYERGMLEGGAQMFEEQLKKTAFEVVSTEMQGDDKASVTISMTIAEGQSIEQTVEVVKIDDKWLFNKNEFN